MKTDHRKPIRVRVTRADIAKGEANSCFRCPVALALARATKDSHANVYERDWLTYLEVWSRHILAPREVVEFVYQFDADDPEDRPPPFRFSLPNQDDPEWKERCYVCEELFAGADLDDEGVCLECQQGE